MSVIYILWLRQLKRYVRSRGRVFVSLGQPLLYLLAFGFGFGGVYRQAGQGDYLQFLAPGVVGMGILFSAVFSGIELIWDKQFGFIKETLVAPVPRWLIMLGRTAGGATVALIQGVIVIVLCLIVGFRPQGLAQLPLLLVYMVLVALFFTALGTVIACLVADFQAFPLVMNFLVLPLFFLSGALFPLGQVPPALAFIARLNPLAYGIDGLRGSLTGAWHFGAAADVAVLGILTLALLLVASLLFDRIEA
ncbi:MAG TPA: ABC transporter permease [Steroidobacteraceae bacterium]|nr:ABC transporter permease [Steroidobacteraceae bacterium]